MKIFKAQLNLNNNVVGKQDDSKYSSAACFFIFFFLLCLYIFMKEHTKILFLVWKLTTTLVARCKSIKYFFYWVPDHLFDIKYNLSFEVLNKSRERKKNKWLNLTDVVCWTRTYPSAYLDYLCFGGSIFVIILIFKMQCREHCFIRTSYLLQETSRNRTDRYSVKNCSGRSWVAVWLFYNCTKYADSL